MSARELGQPTILRDAAPLNCEEIAAISHARARLALGPTARAKLENGRAIVDRIMKSGERADRITTRHGARGAVKQAPAERAPF